jgi:SSS family solute:Na+ symporter
MPGPLHAADWVVLALFLVAMVAIGLRTARRASRDLDEFFLSGRSLPWWIAGTSMVATSFSADTPLVITGWVRDSGVWKNWAWWCYAVSGCLQVFLFARWWRRAGVMTKAEVVELRYGGGSARLLRGTLGVLHATLTNTLIMAWVLLAAGKICEALFGVDRVLALGLASLLALVYSITTGLWGVVLTDLLQFTLAMAGAAIAATIAWNHVGASEGVLAAVRDGTITREHLAIWPPHGPGGLLDASFWTVSLAAAAVYLGVSWWAVENVDGASALVQRVAASRDERQGLLATLWFNVSHYALRPWFWIVVALASLLVLPPIEVRAPRAGVVRTVDSASIVLAHEDGAESIVALDAPPAEPDWQPAPLLGLAPGDTVEDDQVLARTDSESAYVVMMARFLPIGLLGLVVASLVGAFMSTIDTHVNLAASFFVNDVWCRFVRPGASHQHQLLVARLASAGALALGALIASVNDSIGDLFLFLMALLGGVGPIYVLRWVWWRVTAGAELAAMLASVAATVVATHAPIHWSLGPLSPDGALAPEGRILVVVVASLTAALVALLVTRAPDPRALMEFYRRVRPVGWWGPVRTLCPDVEARSLRQPLVASAGALALVYGAMLAPGFWLFERHGALALALVTTAVGAWIVVRALRER